MRRKTLITGSICLAVLPCFALFAVAQQRPAAQQPAASQQPAPSQQPAAGFTMRYDVAGLFNPVSLAIQHRRGGSGRTNRGS